MSLDADRRARVDALRAQGWTLRAIAEAIGVSPAAVHKMLSRQPKLCAGGCGKAVYCRGVRYCRDPCVSPSTPTGAKRGRKRAEE